jgi:macrolide-specific efflux system membrane fusion protein
VTQITTLQGQTVIAAQQAPNILTLADLSTMLVKAQVSEADVIHLKPGQAWFTVLGDPLTRYEGTLKDILPTPKRSTTPFSITPVLKCRTRRASCAWR